MFDKFHLHGVTKLQPTLNFDLTNRKFREFFSLFFAKILNIHETTPSIPSCAVLYSHKAPAYCGVAWQQ